MDRSEETCHIDRIRAITFREAQDAGATFISRSWVANQLKRSETWVKRNWKRNPYDCEMNTENIGRPVVLSQESRDIIEASAGKQRKSIRKLSRELEIVRGKKKTFHNHIQRIGKIWKKKLFHVIKRPNITEQQKDDRFWFCGQFFERMGHNRFFTSCLL